MIQIINSSWRLAEKLIVYPSLNLMAGDDCYCSVAMLPDNPKASAAQQTLPYCLVTPHEVSPSRGAVARIRITVERSQERSREKDFLPPLSELDPPEITLEAEHLDRKRVV